ncbi:MAG: hypothetical protein Q9173_003032 [Seirophora scorigena]
MTYRFQLWEDCHDTWHASLKSHILPGNHERRHGEPFEKQRHDLQALLEDSRRLVEKHSGPLWRIKPWLPKVVFGLISCHVCFFLMPPVTIAQGKRIKIRLQNSRHHDPIANDKSEAPTNKKQALACIFPLWFWYIAFPQVLLITLGGWNAGLSACSVVLLVLLVVHFLNEGRQRRLNVVLTARKDEEASELELPHVELRTFSEFGRDISLGYAMNLKQRFLRRHKGAGSLASSARVQSNIQSGLGTTSVQEKGSVRFYV